MILTKNGLLKISMAALQCYKNNKEATWYKKTDKKWKKKVFDKKSQFKKDNVWGIFGERKDMPNTLFIIFCGSDNDRGLEKGKKGDWGYNLDFKKIVIANNKRWNKDKFINPYENVNPKIKVHRGFFECYLKVRDKILKKAEEKKYDSIIVAGHSLGGGLTQACAVDIQYNLPDKDITAVPISSPRFGNSAFTKSYNKRVPHTYRLMHANDMVTKVPPKWMGFKGVNFLFHFAKVGWWHFITNFFGNPLDHYPHLICEDIEKYLKNGLVLLKKCFFNKPIKIEGNIDDIDDFYVA
jgi:hypothetical protein